MQQLRPKDAPEIGRRERRQRVIGRDAAAHEKKELNLAQEMS